MGIDEDPDEYPQSKKAGRIMYETLLVTLFCVALMGGLALILDQHTEYATLNESNLGNK